MLKHCDPESFDWECLSYRACGRRGSWRLSGPEGGGNAKSTTVHGSEFDRACRLCHVDRVGGCGHSIGRCRRRGCTAYLPGRFGCARSACVACRCASSVTPLFRQPFHSMYAALTLDRLRQAVAPARLQDGRPPGGQLARDKLWGWRRYASQQTHSICFAGSFCPFL